jgi:hypothetical protein
VRLDGEDAAAGADPFRGDEAVEADISADVEKDFARANVFAKPIDRAFFLDQERADPHFFHGAVANEGEREVVHGHGEVGVQALAQIEAELAQPRLPAGRELAAGASQHERAFLGGRNETLENQASSILMVSVFRMTGEPIPRIGLTAWSELKVLTKMTH